MKNRAPLIIIFLTVFLDLVGFGIVFPLLPLYMDQFGISYFQIGLILGSYSLMQFLFAPVLGKLSDRVGRRPVLCVSLLGTALSFYMLALAQGFWWFLFARMLDGVSGSNIATAQAYVADVSKPEARTKTIGMVIGMAFGLGFMLGPFLGGLLGEVSLAFPYIVAGTLALLNTAWALVALPESLPLRKAAHSVGFRTFSPGTLLSALSSPLRRLFLVYGVVILSFAMMEASFSLLGAGRFRLGGRQIYWVFAYVGFVSMIVQGGLIRPLVKRFGEGRLVVGGTLLMAVSLGFLPLYGSLAWLLLMMGVLSLGYGLTNPSLLGMISLGSSLGEQGMMLGIAQSFASLSRFVGPLVGDALLHFGYSWSYGVAGTIMLGVTLVSAPLLWRKPPIVATD